MRTWIGWTLCAAISVMLTGCAGEDPGAGAATAPPPRPLPPPKPLVADAGVEVTAVADPAFDRSREVARGRGFGTRPDPWALLGTERTFEREQQRENLFTSTGGFFPAMYEEPEPRPEDQIIIEPQPYRRLAGILLGNGVAALIQMEDGRVYEILPGSTLPGNPPWTVVSIDAEKAVLRRPGNRLPKEIVVPLGPSAGTLAGQGAPAGGDGGGTGGGGRGRGGADDGDAGTAGPDGSRRR